MYLDTILISWHVYINYPFWTFPSVGNIKLFQKPNLKNKDLKTISLYILLQLNLQNRATGIIKLSDLGKLLLFWS